MLSGSSIAWHGWRCLHLSHQKPAEYVGMHVARLETALLQWQHLCMQSTCLYLAMWHSMDLVSQGGASGGKICHYLIAGCPTPSSLGLWVQRAYSAIGHDIAIAVSYHGYKCFV